MNKLIFYLLIISFYFLSLITYNFLVTHSSSPGNPGGRYESVEKIFYNLGKIPENLKKIFLNEFKNNRKNLLNDKNLNLKIGLNLLNEDIPDGYLLLSKYILEESKSEVVLIDIKNDNIIHRWIADIDKINASSKIDRNILNLEQDLNSKRYGYRHPLLINDGSLIFSMFSPLVKIDVCSKLVWQNDKIFHHSSEFDHLGYLWKPSEISPGAYSKYHEKYLDQHISKINIDNGQIVYNNSLTKILIENNLEHLITSTYLGNNPVHLNDIQPVKKDTEFWKKGDLFLSLRSISTVILYRPSTNKIIWYSQGPWSKQHDVDIIDNTTIGVFNNNTALNNFEFLDKNSEIIYYNFKNKNFSSPFKNFFDKYNIKTWSQGLFDLSKDGLLIESTDFSEIFFFDINNKKLLWSYINDANIYWSRYFTKSEISDTLKNIKESSC